MAHTDQATALAALTNLPAVRGLPTSEDDDFLTNLLIASAGTVPEGGAVEGETTYAAGQVVYRHFYVAASFLENYRNAHTLSKAKGGIEFTGLAKPIAALYALQLAMDTALSLEIPPGYEVPIPMDEQQSSSGTRQGYLVGSSSHGSRLIP